jgi:hypothetical protein
LAPLAAIASEAERKSADAREAGSLASVDAMIRCFDGYRI